MIRKLVLAGFWCIGVTGVAQAQITPLSGFNQVELLVEAINNHGKTCGVTREAVDAAMRITVSNSRLSVPNKVERFDLPTLYSNVHVLSFPDGQCIANVALSLSRQVYLSQNVPPFAVVHATVWDTSTLVSGPSDSFGKRITDIVESQTKLFLGAWLKQN